MSATIIHCYCMFTYDPENYYYPGPPPIPYQNSSFLTYIQLTLSALSHMLIYTAVFEFICAQSPHSMKGLLIGLLYAIKGLYQLLAALLIVPIVVLDYSGYSYFPSCGFYYYLVEHNHWELIALWCVRVCC